jgi:hypothetical protein
MKSKITLFVMLMFIGILSTQAQQGGFQRRTPEERTKMQVDRMGDSLKISAAQQKDVSTVFMDYYKAHDKLREGLAPGTRPERADIEKTVADRDAKLKIILTEQQFTRFKDMEAAMMRNRGGQQRPPGQ